MSVKKFIFSLYFILLIALTNSLQTKTIKSASDFSKEVVKTDSSSKVLTEEMKFNHKFDSKDEVTTTTTTTTPKPQNGKSPPKKMSFLDMIQSSNLELNKNVSKGGTTKSPKQLLLSSTTSKPTTPVNELEPKMVEVWLANRNYHPWTSFLSLLDSIFMFPYKMMKSANDAAGRMLRKGK